jgi:single-stranded-DNA-specific exonuclease
MFPLHDIPEDTVRKELEEYDDLIASLLARRNIKTKKEAEAFLDPSYEEHISDPFLILNMEKAARRIVQAIDTNEKIAVWSDYDCDGIPGGVILHDFLKKVGADFVNYIPHRHNEGYGVNETGLETLARKGVKLVITVDSGIVDNDAVAHANELGMEVIVTDHHLPSPLGVPSAYAVIDAKQEGETSQFTEWCGSGIAWKLVCAVLKIARETEGHSVWGVTEGWEKWLLDMVALATVADMVPLVGENRVLVKYGLIVMRKTKRLGLQRLCKIARVDQRFITEEDIGFMLAPRVNAASRMGDPMDAFILFTTESEAEADERAKELERVNRSRKAVAGATTKAVHEKLQKLNGNIPDVIVLGDPDWRPGLLGLVASGIAEEYGRPVFLWGREGSNTLKGSCRGGPQGVHVVELMRAAQDAFLEFGGHSGAGGYSISVEQSLTLEEKLCEALTKLPPDDAQSFRIDAEISPAEVSHALLKKVQRLAPFGMENEKPVFGFKDVFIEQVAWFGKSGEHIKLTLQVDEFGQSLQAIAFYGKRNLGSVTEKLENGVRAHIAASLEKDMFTRGQPIRLRLVSVRV